jgi:anaerobic dimethyl sulfoxide reductase subunit A
VGHPLTTPSGRIEIASEAYARTGYPDIPTCRIQSSDERHSLKMVTPHARYRVNSTLSNIAWFRKREEQTLWIHPRDAKSRGIGDRQKVFVFNDRGGTRVKARVTQDVMPGVVCLLAGQWPRFRADGLELSGAANTLTSTEPTLPSEGSRTHSTFVEVEIAG